MYDPKIHIEEGYILSCQDCGSTDVMKNGINKQGKRQIRCKSCGTYKTARLLDAELTAENVELDKKRQLMQDKNRIKNKTVREHYRLENALREYAKALINIYREHGLSLKKYNIESISKKNKEGGVGVIHCTDWHGNELINEAFNTFDFVVLSQRAKAYVQESIDRFKREKVRKVLFAVTGDMLNSDRRLDEKIHMSTNRAKATILMQHIMFQAIMHIRKELKVEISIVSVLGNEARIDQEMTFSDDALSNNFDFVIMAGVWNMIKASGIKGIKLISLHKVEEVVCVDGLNFLFMHNFGKQLDNQKNILQTIGRYARDHDIRIDYMIGGHIHDPYITSLSARGGSIAGGNSFSTKALNYASRASQNNFVVKNGVVSPNVVDVQSMNGEEEGYHIIKELEAYNAKSVSKLNKGKVAMQVVII